MNFPDAIKSGFVNCFKFSGRATRSEYWYFTLFYGLCSLAGNIAIAASEYIPVGVRTVSLLCVLAVFLLVPMVPHIAVAMRRLHDTNHSGWWWGALLVTGVAAQILSNASAAFPVAAVPMLLLSFAFLALLLTLLVWMVSRGSAESNRFGPPPSAAVISEQRANNAG